MSTLSSALAGSPESQFEKQSTHLNFEDAVT